jgi:hypothetical protein
MPRGVSPKREREYKKIEKKIEKEGRYKGREKEVAARIVNKQRAKAGETKKAPSTKSKRREEENLTKQYQDYYGHHSFDYSNSPPNRGTPHLALQQRLGLLSNRRLGLSRDHRVSPCSARQDLMF